MIVSSQSFISANINGIRKGGSGNMNQFKWLSLIFLLILSCSVSVSHGQGGGGGDESMAESDQQDTGPEPADANVVAPTNQQTKIDEDWEHCASHLVEMYGGPALRTGLSPQIKQTISEDLRSFSSSRSLHESPQFIELTMLT